MIVGKMAAAEPRMEGRGSHSIMNAIVNHLFR
jgi:hypothetical protein